MPSLDPQKAWLSDGNLPGLLVLDVTIDRAVERRIAGDQPRSIALGAKARHQDRIGNLRERIVAIAAQEIGVQEATGHNDGVRVEEFLAYTALGKGHAWCAAFASWCYGQAGLSAPRNAWSPALFPIARRYNG